MKQLTIVSVSVWLGAMGFFAFVMAPIAFSVLEREAAGRLVAAVMPRYHWMSVGLGLLALAGVIGRSRREAPALLDRVPGVLLLVMLALTLYSLFVVLPEIEPLRVFARSAFGRGGPPSPEALRFARLHRLSTALSLAVMVSGMAVVALEALRRP
jgi:uncharacterized membrane protein